MRYLLARLARLGLALALVTVMSSSTVVPTWAAAITVNTLTDEADGSCNDGDCSLRDAIAIAAPGDTINFGVTGIITLQLGELTLNKQLTISGPGAQNLTLSGNRTSRVFSVNAGVRAIISGVTITQGSAAVGSGVDNAGALSIIDSTFVGNESSDRGTINNTDALDLTNCAFIGNTTRFGGIHNDGAALITACTFISNTAETGAGIMNHYGTLTVSRSTFSNNSATYGSGIFNDDTGALQVQSSAFINNTCCRTGQSYGGGLDNEGAAAVINSTFTGNRATYGGGIGNFKSNGILSVINSTLAGNAGNIHKDGGATTTLTNTIVANSTAGGNCYGALAAASTHNLITDATCTTGFTQVTPTQLALGGLTGAPAYFPLNPGSAAIDTGVNAACPLADQRGVARPQDGNGDSAAICDVGSYEYWLFTPTNWLYLPLVRR